MTASYMSNQSDQELNSQNLKLGLIMNDLIHDRTIEDTIVYNDLEKSLSDFGDSEIYSQAFIILLSKAVSDNNTSKISSENPGPSSHTFIKVILLLLSKPIFTDDLLYFTAFPIKFLNP